MFPERSFGHGEWTLSLSSNDPYPESGDSRPNLPGLVTMRRAKLVRGGVLYEKYSSGWKTIDRGPSWAGR